MVMVEKKKHQNKSKMYKFKVFPISLFVIILIIFCSTIEASSDSSKYMKYEVKSGIIKYKVFILNEHQKELELYKFDVAFNNFGSEELITWYNNDSIKFYYKSEETQKNLNSIEYNMNRTWNLYTELFVTDEKSLLYKGIKLYKGSQVKYFKKKCIKFHHFQFKDLNISGNVIFHKGIPLKIKLSDNGHIFVIKAYEMSFIGPTRSPVITLQGSM